MANITNLQISAITEDSFKVTWNEPVSGASYKVDVEPGGHTQTVTANNATFSGLTESTSYTVTVVTLSNGTDTDSDGVSRTASTKAPFVPFNGTKWLNGEILRGADTSSTKYFEAVQDAKDKLKIPKDYVSIRFSNTAIDPYEREFVAKISGEPYIK